jgi:cobalt-precorrin 5A hydrolase
MEQNDNGGCSGSPKRRAVIALTKGGIELALRLEEEIDGFELYFPEKLVEYDRHHQNDRKHHYYSSLKDLTAELFHSSDALVYIMALGIVVRMIAPHLQSKRSDPAVITIDETAKNVISTISGHIGGANQLSWEIAEKLRANAVITTATDCRKLEAVDLLAERIGAEIIPFARLKFANAALVNGEGLNIFSDYQLDIDSGEQINIYPLKMAGDKKERTEFKVDENEVKKAGFSVIISNRKLELETEELQLLPKNIVIGIGCRKNISKEKIARAVDAVLAELELSPRSIKKFATIDLKKEEKGILAFAEEKGLELEIVSREKIREVEDQLEVKKSEFVKKAAGVYAAAAPAAILSSGPGTLIKDKMKFSGVTIAVFEEELENGEQKASDSRQQKWSR